MCVGVCDLCRISEIRQNNNVPTITYVQIKWIERQDILFKELTAAPSLALRGWTFEGEGCGRLISKTIPRLKFKINWPKNIPCSVLSFPKRENLIGSVVSEFLVFLFN